MEDPRLEAIRVLRSHYQQRIAEMEYLLGELEREEARLAQGDVSEAPPPARPLRGQVKREVDRVLQEAGEPMRIKEVTDALKLRFPGVPYYTVRTTLQRGVTEGRYVNSGDGYAPRAAISPAGAAGEKS
jgi:hypothetical protein